MKKIIEWNKYWRSFLVTGLSCLYVLFAASLNVDRMPEAVGTFSSQFIAVVLPLIALVLNAIVHFVALTRAATITQDEVSENRKLALTGWAVPIVLYTVVALVMMFALPGALDLINWIFFGLGYVFFYMAMFTSDSTKEIVCATSDKEKRKLFGDSERAKYLCSFIAMYCLFMALIV